MQTYQKLVMETQGQPFMVSGMAGMRKVSVLDDRCLIVECDVICPRAPAIGDKTLLVKFLTKCLVCLERFCLVVDLVVDPGRPVFFPVAAM